MGGVIIGGYSKFHKGINKKYLTTFIISLSMIFIFLPIGGSNQIFMVTGFEKLIISICVFGLCASVAYWRNTGESQVNKGLKYFGDISYSLYLFHPIVYTIITMVFSRIDILNNAAIILTACVVITLMVSSISYYVIENPISKLARKNKFELKKAT